MRTCLLAASLVIGVSMFAACGGDDEDELPDVDCSGSVPAFDDVAALKKCATCHSSKLSGGDRKNAPANVNFDTQAAAESHDEKAAEEVNEGAMPPAGSGVTLTNDEKQVLYTWALCR